MKNLYSSLFLLSFSQLAYAQCSPDLTPPMAMCQNITVYLDAAGSASISVSDIDNGSFDNCSGVSIDASQTSFDCTDLGINNVTLTVTDSASSEIVDQENLNSTTISGWGDVAQSFTAGQTGTMIQLELKTGYNSGQFSTLSIHSGAGNSGPILSTQVIDMLQSGGNSVVTNLITLATPVSVVSGQVYSFVLTGNFGQVTGVNTGGNPYPNGQVLNGGNSPGAPFDTWDMYFRTIIESGANPNTSSCTATVTVVDTISPLVNVATLADIIGCFGDAIDPTVPTANDNCSGLITGTPDVSFPITNAGTTVVTWTYNDGNGNTVTQTQNVILNSVDVSVTQNGAQLTANQSGVAYQWLDCDNSNAILVGEINQFFTPTITGNYAVQVTENNCIDTSACVLVDFTSLGELNLEEKKLIMVVDLIGKKTTITPNTPLIYVYSDGTRERIVKIKE